MPAEGESAGGEEQRARAILDQVSDVFLALDRELRLTFVNRRFAEIVGRDVAELTGALLLEALPEVRGSAWHHAYEQVLESGQPTSFDAYFEPLDRWFETRVYPSDDGLVVLATDTTEARENSLALAETTELLGALFRSAPVVIGTIAPDGTLTSWSPAGERMLGWREEELRGKGSMVVPEERLDETRALYARAVGGETILGVETQRLHKDGSVVDVSLSLAPLRDAEGTVTGIVGVLEDITARKRAERVLLESEERVRLAARSADLGVWEVNLREGVAYADARACEIIGVEPRSTPDAFFERVHPDDRTRVESEVEAALSGDAAYASDFRVAGLRDGASRWVRASGTVVRDEHGRAERMLGVVHDVTESRRAESGLLRSAERLRILRLVDENLLRSRSPEEIAESVLGRTRELVGAPRASLALVDDDVPTEMRLVAVSEDAVSVEVGTRLEVAGAEAYLGPGLGGSVTRIADIDAILDRVPESMRMVRAAGYRSALVVRLEAEGAVLGLLFLFFRDTGPPCSEEDVEVAREVATTLAAALDHARARTVLEVRTRQQAAVAELGAMALRSEKLGDLLQIAVEVVAAQLDADLAKVLELQPDGDSFLLRAGVGWEDGLTGTAIVPGGRDSQAGYTLVTREPVVVADLAAETRFSGPALLHDHGVTSGISVVIAGGERPYGVLGVHTRARRAFTEDDRNFVRSVANVLAEAIQRHRAVTALRTFAAELEERVAQRTREAEAARADAELANMAKSAFISSMSHELRTPLNAVLGFAQLLAMDGLTDSQRGNVDQILRAGRHLLDLINEVLDIAGIEAGRLALSVEPVEASAAVLEARDLVIPLAVESGVELAEPDLVECWVLADRQRLLQILLNLLSNAISYNCPGGRVELSCDTPEEGIWELAVRDTGPGLSEAEVERLFRPFERLSSAAGTTGTGLGLAVARGLAQAMGGDLRCVSAVGEGSTFSIRLRAAAEPDGEPDPGEPAAPGTRVVHIDDNPATAELVRNVAGRAGWDVLGAGTGEDGVELALRERPDVVLLDLHLPDMAGERVLARLRADPRTAGTPVLVLSADATSDAMERLRDAGAAGFLTKPVDLEQLREAVSRAAARREAP